MFPSVGVYYIATGDKYLHEAFHNVRLTRSFNPSLSVSVCTHDTVEARQSGLFDNVVQHPCPVYSYRDKIQPLIDPPYDNTLYLDTDAFSSYSLDSIFSLADFVDIACAAAPVRHPPGWSDSEAPMSFTEFNSGVILLKKSHQQKQFFNKWLALYDKLFRKFSQSWDQASFRSILWRRIKMKKLQFLQLPSEANLRTTKPWIAGRGMPVQIIHGRFAEHETNKFLTYLNSDINKFRTSSEWLKLYPDSSIRPRFDNSGIT